MRIIILILINFVVLQSFAQNNPNVKFDTTSSLHTSLDSEIMNETIGDDPLVTDPESLIPNSYELIEPTMAALGRYGNYSVNLANGLPDISFTLYSIRSGSLIQPITLSYHGGGIKVSEDASWVGLGWSLNYGSTISRTVFGKPDEQENLSAVPIASYVREQMEIDPYDYNNTYFKALAEEESYSFRQDQYYFNIPGRNGFFVLDENQQAISIPHLPVKIDFSSPTKKIIDSDGTSYSFISCDETRPSKGSYYTSSWSIKKIVSADGNDYIEYFYNIDGLKEKWNPKWYDGYQSTDNPYISGSRIGLKKVIGLTTVAAQKPTTITFKNGLIVFYLGDRHDIKEPNTSQLLDNGLKKLEKIEIYNVINQQLVLLKTINFSYSYFGTSGDPSLQRPESLRLRLDSITEIAGEEKKLFASFDYEDMSLPDKTSYSYDHWGYYNGSNNISPIPSFSFYSGSILNIIKGAVKTPSESHMKSGSLNSVKYPTGGKTYFNWEINDCYTDNIIKIGSNMVNVGLNSSDIPGISDLDHINNLRGVISDPFFINTSQSVIINYYIALKDALSLDHDKFDKAEVVLYKDDPLIGEEIFYHNSFGNTTMKHEVVNLDAGHEYYLCLRVNCPNVNAHIDLDYLDTPPNNQKINYQVGGLRISSMENYNVNNELISKKIYQYKIPGTNNSSGVAKTDFSDIDYSVSSVSLNKYPIGGNPANCLQVRNTTWISYSNAVAGIYSSPVSYQHVQEFEVMENNVENGYTDYEFSVSSDYLPMKDILISNEWERGDLVRKKIFKRNNDNSYKLLQDIKNVFSLDSNYQKQIRGFKMYRHIDGLELCGGSSSTEVQLYDIYEPLNYYFNSYWKHLDSTIVKNMFDSNDVIDTTIRYYYNYRHCQPSVTRMSLNNGIALKENIYTSDEGSGAPNEMWDKNNANFKHILNSIVEEKITINGIPTSKKHNKYSYDTSKDMILTDYVNIYPTATDENYTVNFEYNIRGDLAIHTIGNDISTYYIWGYNEGYPIVKIESSNANIDVFSIQNNVNNLSLSGSDNKIQIDMDISNIKEIIPANLISENLVTFYTYKPLVGMTSQTDPAGRTTYFQYDDFGRLKLVRDQDNNIVSKNEYHYAE